MDREMEGQRRLKAGCSALRAPELGTSGANEALICVFRASYIISMHFMMFGDDL